jgi:hypothetical protein
VVSLAVFADDNPECRPEQFVDELRGLIGPQSWADGEAARPVRDLPMPIHDWARVTAGTWHDFHLAWSAELRNALNGGILPPDYYAQAEQIAGPLGPDVLTLQMPDLPSNGTALASESGGGVAISAAPPRVRLTAEATMDDYVLKRRTLVIRHASGDRIVALLEIVSPGNKGSRHAPRAARLRR